MKYRWLLEIIAIDGSVVIVFHRYPVSNNHTVLVTILIIR